MIFSRETLGNCAELSVGLGSLLGHKNWNRKRKKGIFMYLLSWPRRVFAPWLLRTLPRRQYCQCQWLGRGFGTQMLERTLLEFNFYYQSSSNPSLHRNFNTSEKETFRTLFLFKKSPHGASSFYTAPKKRKPFIPFYHSFLEYWTTLSYLVYDS